MSERTGAAAEVDPPAAEVDAPADVEADAPGPGLRGRALEAIGLFAFTLWVAAPMLRPGALVIGFDTITYGGPNAGLTAKALRSGHLPTWNDAIFGGIPHLANPNASALYPLRWLLLPFGPERTLGLVAALHLFVLAAGCLALAHRLRWRPPAGLVAGVVLVGCGSTMVKVLQTEQLAVVAWAPWLLVAVDAVLAARRPARAVAGLGAVGGVVLVAGHPQMVYVLAPVVGAWALGRAIDRGAYRQLLRIVPAGVLALALASAQLLPTAQLLGETVSSQSRPVALAGDPAYTAKPTLVAGNVLGDPFERTQLAVGGSGEANLSVGAACAALCALALVLALRGGASRGFRATVALLAVAAAGAWVLSLGPRTFVYRAAADVLPGFSQARVPGRWLVASSVAMATLAGWAVSRVAAGAVRPSRAAGLARVVAVGVAGIWWGRRSGHLLLPPTGAPRAWLVVGVAVALVVAVAAARPRRAVLAGAAVALALLPVWELGEAQRHSPARALAVDDRIAGVEGDLARQVAASGDRSVAITYDRFENSTYLLEALRPNANVLFGVRNLDGYDGGPQLTLRWIDTMGALVPSFNRDLTLRAQVPVWPPALLARFGVRWAIVDTTPGTPPVAQLLPGWRGPVATEGVLELWENPAYAGEAEVRLATTPVAPEDAGKALAARVQAGDPAALVDPGGTTLGCTAACAPTPATLQRGLAGHLSVQLDAPADGLLVVDEQYLPGWKAWVDGKAVHVQPADGMFLGVAVGPGPHVVRLRYDAPGLRTGLVLTTLGLLVVLACTAAGPRLPTVAEVRARRRGDAAPPPPA